MKFSANKDQIIDGLQKAADIIPAKAGAAYLRSIWLKAEDNRISIMATDANIEFTGTYQAEVMEPGLVGVQGKGIVDLVRRLPAGILKFSLDGEAKNLLLEQGKRSYRLPVSGPEWFQDFSAFPVDDSVVWAGDVLQDILDRVTFCIDDDDSKDAMSCLYFKPVGGGKINVCGLNGHQFAMSSLVEDNLSNRLGERGLLIQKKSLGAIKKWLTSDEIELNITEKKFFLKRMDGGELLSVPKANYEYPDYNVFLSRLDEKNVSKLKIARKEAIEALGRILVFNTEQQGCVHMHLSSNEVNLSAEGADTGSARETLEIQYDGDMSKISFPTKNLMEVFSHFVSEYLEMKFTGPEGPCGIMGQDETDYVVVIMPMKVSEAEYYQEEEN